jgi:hypothetical protein
MAGTIANHRLQIPLSSSGLTGRSSTPRALDLIARVRLRLLDTRFFAGMTRNASVTKTAGMTKKTMTGN